MVQRMYLFECRPAVGVGVAAVDRAEASKILATFEEQPGAVWKFIGEMALAAPREPGVCFRSWKQLLDVKVA